MATEPTDAPPPALKEEESRPEDDRPRVDLLYDKCAEAPDGTVFFQRDLSQMAIAQDLGKLMEMLQELVDRHLMKLMTFDNEPCWKLRSREEAEKLRKLTSDERLLYHHIDQAQAEGIWSKALRARTNLQPATLTKLLKNLENKELVQCVMSVKYPNRKMYLLKHLRPSGDIAGGPWQSEGEFDTALIGHITQLVVTLVQRQTCVTVHPGYNDYQTSTADSDRAIEISHKKAQVKGVMDIEEAPAVKPYRPPMDRPRLVPRHKPKYPTAASLRNDVMATGVIKDKEIQESDMEQLLEMMVLEGRLEKISGTNYRLAMRATDNESLNGFVDAPCGTCPVFELCGDSGEISARTCVYFGEWLSTESEAVS